MRRVQPHDEVRPRARARAAARLRRRRDRAPRARRRRPDGPAIARGADPAKDQSYVLYMLGADELARTLLADRRADEGRRARPRPRRSGCAPRPSAESMDVCFITRGGRGAFLGARIARRPRRDRRRRRARSSARTTASTRSRSVSGAALGVAVGERRYVDDIAAGDRDRHRRAARRACCAIACGCATCACARGRAAGRIGARADRVRTVTPFPARLDGDTCVVRRAAAARRARPGRRVLRRRRRARRRDRAQVEQSRVGAPDQVGMRRRSAATSNASAEHGRDEDHVGPTSSPASCRPRRRPNVAGSRSRIVTLRAVDPRRRSSASARRGPGSVRREPRRCARAASAPARAA